MLLMLATTCATAKPASYSVLHAFTGGADGAEPGAGVVGDNEGNVYGENENGAQTCYPLSTTSGCGVVYKIDPHGNTTTLLTFVGTNGASGSNPLTLVGNRLYGAVSGDSVTTYGQLFAVDTDGSNYTLLHQFVGTDGFSPTGALRVMSDGVIYGTTRGGGNVCSNCLAGVLFELDPDGTFKVLHQFDPLVADNSYEPGQIFVAPNGMIVGSTQGYTSGGNGGSIYKYVPSTGNFTTLHNFHTKKDGAVPQIGGFTRTGEIYGAAELGGADNAGTLFQVGGGGFKTLYTFEGREKGEAPNQPTMISTGQILGTLQGGGSTNAGSLYIFDGTKLKILYRFSVENGALSYPEGGIFVGRGGVVSGAAHVTLGSICRFPNGVPVGGVEGCGGIFSIVP